MVETTTVSIEKLIVAQISWLHSNIFVPILFVVAILTAIANTTFLFVMLRSKGFRKIYTNWLMIFLSFADDVYGRSMSTCLSLGSI